MQLDRIGLRLGSRSLRPPTWLLVLASLFVFASPDLRASVCTGFADVAEDSAFCVSVDWVKARGITLGCSQGRYCPDAPASRLQMAAFLNRLGSALHEGASVVEEEADVSSLFPSQLLCESDGNVFAKSPGRLLLDVVASVRSAEALSAFHELVVSFDDGASWSAAGDQPMPVSVTPNLIANSRLTADVEVAGGSRLRAAYRIRTSSEGTAAVQCKLRVRTQESDQPIITQLSPAHGRSGRRILVKGKGFTETSTFHFGTLPAAEVVFVDSTQMLVTVPLENQRPADSARVLVSVDGVPAVSFQIDETPQNPHPPGHVLSTVIAELSSILGRMGPGIDADLAELQAAETDPVIANYLGQLRTMRADTLDLIVSSGEYLPSGLSPQELDVMERVLLQAYDLLKAAPGDGRTVMAASNLPGDDWLDGRGESTRLFRALDSIATGASLICTAVVTTPPGAIGCFHLAIGGGLSMMLVDAPLAKAGYITRVEIWESAGNATRAGAPDRLSLLLSYAEPRTTLSGRIYVADGAPGHLTAKALLKAVNPINRYIDAYAARVPAVKKVLLDRIKAAIASIVGDELLEIVASFGIKLTRGASRPPMDISMSRFGSAERACGDPGVAIAESVGATAVYRRSGVATGPLICPVSLPESETIGDEARGTQYAIRAVPATLLEIKVDGPGTVMPSPQGNDCGSNCKAWDAGSQLTLTASPDAGASFVAWRDNWCSGTQTPVCHLTIPEFKDPLPIRIHASFADGAPTFTGLVEDIAASLPNRCVTYRWWDNTIPPDGVWHTFERCVEASYQLIIIGTCSDANSCRPGSHSAGYGTCSFSYTFNEGTPYSYTAQGRETQGIDRLYMSSSGERNRITVWVAVPPLQTHTVTGVRPREGMAELVYWMTTNSVTFSCQVPIIDNNTGKVVDVVTLNR